jgi:hypothetical protein
MPLRQVGFHPRFLVERSCIGFKETRVKCLGTTIRGQEMVNKEICHEARLKITFWSSRDKGASSGLCLEL